MRKKIQNVVELYTIADNYFMFFDENEASRKAEEIKSRNKLAIKVERNNKITIFEIKKVI
jgi:hypothetical protein